MEYEKLLGKVIRSDDGIYTVGAIGKDFIVINGIFNGYVRDDKEKFSASFKRFDEQFRFVDEEAQKIWDDFKQ